MGRSTTCWTRIRATCSGSTTSMATWGGAIRWACASAFDRGVASAVQGRRLAAVTAHAVEQKSQHAGAALRGRHPGTVDEGRLVAHVLAVTAGEFGDPVAQLVLVVAGDLLLHAVGLPLIWPFSC